VCTIVSRRRLSAWSCVLPTLGFIPFPGCQRDRRFPLPGVLVFTIADSLLSGRSTRLMRRNFTRVGATWLFVVPIVAHSYVRRKTRFPFPATLSSFAMNAGRDIVSRRKSSTMPLLPPAPSMETPVFAGMMKSCFCASDPFYFGSVPFIACKILALFFPAGRERNSTLWFPPPACGRTMGYGFPSLLSPLPLLFRLDYRSEIGTAIGKRFPLDVISSNYCFPPLRVEWTVCRPP